MKEDAFLTNTRSAQGTTSLLAITKLLDVEEDIWVPKLGLKGKIDASVQATVLDKSAISKTQATSVMPLEIKTGRMTSAMEHRAQTMLYTLLMSDRYDVDVAGGLLYYTQSDDVIRVPAARNELKALIMARNELAGYIVRRKVKVDSDDDVKSPGGHWLSGEPFLPPTIDNERVCGRCYSSDACMLYKKVSKTMDQDLQASNLVVGIRI